MVEPNKTYVDNILFVTLACGIKKAFWAAILIFPAEHKAGRPCKPVLSLYLGVQDVAYPPPCTHTTTAGKIHMPILDQELGRLAYLAGQDCFSCPIPFWAP